MTERSAEPRPFDEHEYRDSSDGDMYYIFQNGSAKTAFIGSTVTIPLADALSDEERRLVGGDE